MKKPDTIGTIIITGASRGLGKEMAKTAFEAGFSVALISRSKTDLEKVKREIEKSTIEANKNSSSTHFISTHAVDLTREKSVTSCIDNIILHHSSVRALINNAGTWMGTGSVSKLKASDIQSSLDLNFFSAFHPTMALLRKVGSKTRSELAIINVGATAGLDSWPEVLPFCLAKGALRGFSRALAREFGPKGVHVGHLVIDGVLNNQRTRNLNRNLKSDRYIQLNSVAQSILQVVLQDRSCWTAEWDVRPSNENW